MAVRLEHPALQPFYKSLLLRLSESPVRSRPPLPESPAPTLLSGRLLLAIAQNDRGGGRRLERSTREGTDVASRWRQSVNAGNGQVCSLRRWRVPWPAGESKRGGADFGVKASEFYNVSGETKRSVCGLHVNDDR